MIIGTDSGKDGLKTAIAELHDPNLPIESEAEQLELPALPLEGKNPASGAELRRGPGRPAGAKNKSTEEWRRYLLARYRSPLEALAQTYNCTLEDLAARIGVMGKLTFEQAMELLKLQLMAAKELAPYIHQKMPLAIEGGENGLIQLVINQGQATAQAGPDAVGQAIKFINTPDEQNQMVTDADFTNSNETDSN